jgi:hypothetical protein
LAAKSEDFWEDWSTATLAKDVGFGTTSLQSAMEVLGPAVGALLDSIDDVADFGGDKNG